MKFKYLSVLAMAVFLISCGETEKPEEVKAELTGDCGRVHPYLSGYC